MSTASCVFIYKRENYQFQMERFIKRADINYNEKKNGKKGLLKSKKTSIEIVFPSMFFSLRIVVEIQENKD